MEKRAEGERKPEKTKRNVFQVHIVHVRWTEVETIYQLMIAYLVQQDHGLCKDRRTILRVLFLNDDYVKRIKEVPGKVKAGLIDS